MNDRDTVEHELLVLASQAGDRGSFARLAARWHPRLLAIATAQLRDADAAQDVVQEAWLAIVRGLGGLNSPGAFPGWAVRITRNKAADHLRGAVARRRALPPPVVGDGSAESRRPVREPGLREAVAALSEPHREVVVLHYAGGLSVSEIADLVGVPAGTVKSRLHGARRELRRHLEGSDA